MPIPRITSALALLLLCHTADASPQDVDAGLEDGGDTASDAVEPGGAEGAVDEQQATADTAPAQAVANETEAREPDSALGALEQEPGLEIEGRLGALWRMQDAAEEPRNEFRISVARLELTWTQWQLVEASISLEGRHLLDGSRDFSILRDLYVRVQPLSWIGLRMGQFKKPFSRVELTSRRKRSLITKGMANDYAIEHLMYGDRDIGVMLEGRLVQAIKLDYAIGLFNGLGKNTAEIAFSGSKDLAARIDAKPAKWLSVGADVSLKLIDKGDLPAFVDEARYADVDPEEYPLGYTDADLIAEHEWMAGPAWMTGADVGLKIEKLRVAAEGMLGENWWFEKYPYLWSALLEVSYKIRLGEGVPLWLEPAVRGETMTILTSMSEWRVRLWQVAPAVNLHIGKHVRLMLDGEFVFAQGSEADVDGSRRDGLWPNEWPGALTDSKRLMLQLIFET